MWSLLFVIALGALGLVFYPVVHKKFFQKKEKEELSQARWLYWCADQETNPCFYVARDGSSLGEAPYLFGALFPKFYGSREALMAALPFVSRFYEFGKFIANNDDTLEIGWPNAMQLKISLKDNPEEIAKNFALILEKEIGDRRDKVDYIDLRFGNRVYYKFR